MKISQNEQSEKSFHPNLVEVGMQHIKILVVVFALLAFYIRYYNANYWLLISVPVVWIYATIRKYMISDFTVNPEGLSGMAIHPGTDASSIVYTRFCKWDEISNVKKGSFFSMDMLTVFCENRNAFYIPKYLYTNRQYVQEIEKYAPLNCPLLRYIS